MNSIGFFATKFLPSLVFRFVLKVVFSISCVVDGFVVDLGMAFVDNWVVGKEKGCYWLINDIVGLAGNLVV